MSSPNDESLQTWLGGFSSTALAKEIAPLLARENASPDERSKVLTRLLDATLRMAAYVPYWRNKIPPGDVGSALDRLKTIEPMHRATVEVKRHELLSPLTTFLFCSFTSSSTTGLPLIIERSVEEQTYIKNFFSNFIDTNAYKGKFPLGLSAININHGDLLSPPMMGYSFPVNLYTDSGYLTAEHLLSREFEISGYNSRISFISGSFSCLYRLCTFLKERGYRVKPNQIESLTAYGSPIPGSARRIISDFFMCTVDDNWSMAEAFGPAAYCHSEDNYQFSPFIWPEIIDPQTGEVLEEDDVEGELVITPLFPFTQRFVLLRYRTGDLVKRTASPRRGMHTGFRFLGRLSRSVRLADGTWIGSIPAALALYDQRELARPQSPITLLEDRSAGEFPWFRLETKNADRGLVVRLSAKNGGSPILKDVIHRKLIGIFPGVDIEIKFADPSEINSIGAWKV